MSNIKKSIFSLVIASLTLAGCGGGAGVSTPSSAPSGGGTGGSTLPLLTLAVPPAAPIGVDYHPAGKGWTLAWSDEFDGSQLDRSKWEVEESCWGGGNNERQCYTDREDNVEVVNGLLRLKAYPEVYTGLQYPQGWPGGDRGPQVTQQYTSGKVRTRELADWTYGRFSARMKLPQGQGTWPAFWMLPADNNYGPWAASGEIDIMEAANLGAACSDCPDGTVENRTSGALHFGGEWPSNTYLTDKWTLLGGTPVIEDYHVYTAEWGQGRINWFVDGVKLMTLDSEDWFSVNATKDTDPYAPFNKSFYLMFNFAVGGGLSEDHNEGGLDPDNFPSEMLIDWVRVYICDFDGTTGRRCMHGEDTE